LILKADRRPLQGRTAIIFINRYIDTGTPYWYKPEAYRGKKYAINFSCSSSAFREGAIPLGGVRVDGLLKISMLMKIRRLRRIRRVLEIQHSLST